MPSHVPFQSVVVKTNYPHQYRTYLSNIPHSLCTYINFWISEPFVVHDLALKLTDKRGARDGICDN